jgi:hypothetical protein
VTAPASTSTIIEGATAVHLARLRSVLTSLEQGCSVCWALGGEHLQHTFTRCHRGIANGQDKNFTSFRLNVQYAEGLCFGCGLQSSVGTHSLEYATIFTKYNGS